MTDKKPLCDQCRDTAGWLEDADGNITGRCECRYRDIAPQQAREQGVAATVDANPDAMRAALAIIREAALASETFTANDVRVRMEIAQVPGPTIGAAFGQAVRDGLIRRDGWVQSSLANTHSHEIKLWRSLIWRPTAGRGVA